MRAPVRTLFLLAAGPVSLALAQSNSWVTYGPPLFQVNAVATGADETAVYAASADYDAVQSTIFRSPDGGRTWTPLVDASRGEYYGDILVGPGTPATIYAGALGTAGATNLYRSPDAGETWTLTGTTSSYCGPSFAPTAAASTVLVSCGTQVLRSTDSGATWANLPNTFTEPIRLTPGAAGSILAFGPTKIFKSTNNGTSWSPAGTAPAACPGLNALRVSPANASVLVAGTGLTGAGGFQCGGVYRSTDGGNTWSPSSLDGVFMSGVLFDPGSPSHVYASAGYLAGVLPRGGVWDSLDGGATWTNLLLPALGASRLAASATGHTLYAATSLGVFALAGAGGGAPCASNDETLCLDAARFRVRAAWSKQDGTGGQGRAVPLTGDTGYFWFFDSANVEVMVKVLEGCGVDGHRWVFASGLTNVAVELTVTDTVSGTTNTYRNPQGTAFLPIQDTGAFACE